MCVLEVNTAERISTRGLEILHPQNGPLNIYWTDYDDRSMSLSPSVT